MAVGAVLFGQEVFQTITANGVTNVSLGSYGAPGYNAAFNTVFPASLTDPDASLQVGDDLWVVAYGYPISVTNASVTASISGWTRTHYAKIDFLTFPDTNDVAFFNYGPSPVDALGWASWAPNVTLTTANLSFGSLYVGFRAFAIRNAVTTPQFEIHTAVTSPTHLSPTNNTWTGSNTYAIGLVGGPNYSGGGVGPGNVALYPNGDGPINGWDLATPTDPTRAVHSKTWYGRITEDTAAPDFIIDGFGWYWFGFQIPSIATGWSVGQIRY